MTASIMEFSIFPEWNAWKPAFFRDWHRAEYYNARNYDQMTGRFMQTDPKFTERAGFDAYDPYSYVASNPVNFTDPTGECPTLQKPGIMGNYSGSGNCDGPLPNWWMNHEYFLFWLGYGIQTGDYRAAIAVYIYYNLQVRKPLTEVDKAAQIHDMEFPGFDSPERKRSIRSNKKWLSKAGWIPGLGPKFMYDPSYWGKTFKREQAAVPDWIKDHNARTVIAGVNTVGTFIADAGVSLIGTIIFSTDILVVGTRLNVNKATEYIKSRKFTSNYKNWKL